MICCTPTVLDDAHEHPLEFKSNKRTLYRCGGCKEIGFGPFYECGSCNFQLHEECTNLSSTSSSPTTHSLFENVQFIFQKQPPENVGSCVACGMNVQGFRYHEYSRPKKNAFVGLFVPTKELVLHPCCFRLPSNKTTPEGVTNINLELKEKAPSNCLICQRKKISKKIQGWAYVSTCGEYCYHVKCVKESVDKKFDQQSDGTDASSLRLEVTHMVVEVGVDILVVLALIIQAIFGDPLSAIVSLVMYFNKQKILGQKKLTAG
ncbi:hypothetical protein FH972_001462 [Carpinus fangiana]|uniref:DC1 domain-containing protein n=1 Tax=Carpinus fangiana TaxID=176857 RepID=A0A5N6QE66_9ROSI|nr:hypothetical protein FH972_001462 [Carpinus fangiana]